MKVIGNAGGDVLVTLSREEFGRLCGFRYGHQFRDFLAGAGALDKSVGGYEPCPLVGVELPIGAWTEQLAAIRSRRDDMEKLSGTLRGLADLIDGAFPVLAEQIKAVEGGAS